MKSFGIVMGLCGLFCAATACSDSSGTASPTGSAGSAGTTAASGSSAGGSVSGAASGGTAGNSSGGGSSAGGGGASAGGGMGGSSGSAAAGGGMGGSGGVDAGGTGGGGGTAPACDTNLGKAIKFVGQNTIDMVAGDLGADGPQGDDARTVELWAKFTSAESWTAEHTIIELGVPSQPDNGNNVFGIDMSGRNGDAGVFGPYTHGCSDNNGTSAPPQLASTPVDVGWLHLSWAYDPSKQDPSKRLEFTVNGNPLPTEFVQGKYDATGGKLVLNTGYVLLGASQHFGHQGWDGVMDEVRVWNVYRTPQQVKDAMKVIVKPDTPGLVAYYQFNEGDAANVGDSTLKASHKLIACTQASGACPEANGAAPSFVDSDIPGPFTCAP